MQFSIDSEYGRLGKWTYQEQRELFDFASSSNQYAKDVLTTTVDSLAGIAASVERNLPFVEIALLRIVLESAGVVLWLTAPGITSRERLRRLVKCELAESYHEVQLIMDQINAGNDLEEDLQQARDRALRAAEWRQVLGLQSTARMPDESDLIDIVARAEPTVGQWQRTLLSSLIHSRVFAIGLVIRATRTQDSYQSDLAGAAALAFLRAFEALGNFTMGNTYGGSKIESEIARLRYSRP